MNNGIKCCFLTIDEAEPLGIYLATNRGSSIVELDEFFEESKIDMSKSIAAQYAERFRAFADELAEYAKQPPEVD